MSLFHPINLVCPNCEASVTMDAVGSVNADRRPDLREAILEDSFQDTTCPNCEESFRLQPQFNYLDAGRRQWIAAFPAARMPDYAEIEDEVDAIFAASYGRNAPEAARSVGDDLDVRLTFGWPAVREKLLAREHGLDDVVLELLKLDLMRRVDSSPMSVGVELRLMIANDTALTLVWMESTTEKPIQEITVPMEHYAAIADNPEPWEKLRQRFDGHSFVDMQRLYMREAAEEDAA